MIESNFKIFDELNDVVMEFYHQAYQRSLIDFKHYAFETLQRYLAIDSGTWITRTEQNIPFYEQDGFLFNLPAGFLEHYHQMASVSTQVQQVFGVMLGNLGKTMDILDIVPENEWYGSDMYNLYCNEFDLQHSLMTVLISPHNQVMNILTVARHDAQKPFSEQDKQIKEFLVPNIIEAMRLNLLHNVSEQTDKLEAYRGIFDNYGNLIEAEDNFIATLKEQEWLIDQKFIHFPKNFSSQQVSLNLEGLAFAFSKRNGFVFVEILLQPLEKRLSEQKMKICSLLIQGLSNKAIAAKLDLSPNTVSNHLKVIFKTLNVDSRQKAISYLLRQKVF